MTLTVDKLDAEDGIPLPPSNVVVVDVYADLTDEDTWLLGGLRGFADGGAHFLYALDPNSRVIATAPGTDHRFVTFVGTPQARDADERFGQAGAAHVGPRLCGGDPTPQLNPFIISLTYTQLIPPQPNPGMDGYVARFTLNLSQVADPRFQVDSDDIVVALTQPPGSVRLFETEGCRPQDPGMIATTWFNWHRHIDFGIYGIPEPATAVLLVLGSLVIGRRR